jgi:hypothetical protein
MKMKMKMKYILVVAAVLGSASLAHAAQTIVSPALQTPSNTAGACYFRNIGTTPISLHAQFLENFVPDFLLADFQNCNDAPLAGGRTCVLLVNDLPDDVTFGCSAVVTKGNVKNLRAAAELRAITPSGLQVIAAQELR